jgi:hypothetical protein
MDNRLAYIIYFCLFMFMALFLSCSESYGASAMFKWDRNSETDLAGYKAYQSRYANMSAAKVFYNGTSNRTKIFTHFTAVKRYYIAVKAYNTSNLISGYSNIISLYPTVGGVSVVDLLECPKTICPECPTNTSRPNVNDDVPVKKVIPVNTKPTTHINRPRRR